MSTREWRAMQSGGCGLLATYTGRPVAQAGWSAGAWRSALLIINLHLNRVNSHIEWPCHGE